MNVSLISHLSTLTFLEPILEWQREYIQNNPSGIFTPEAKVYYPSIVVMFSLMVLPNLGPIQIGEWHQIFWEQALFFFRFWLSWTNNRYQKLIVLFVSQQAKSRDARKDEDDFLPERIEKFQCYFNVLLLILLGAGITILPSWLTVSLLQTVFDNYTWYDILFSFATLPIWLLSHVLYLPFFVVAYLLAIFLDKRHKSQLQNNKAAETGAKMQTGLVTKYEARQKKIAEITQIVSAFRKDQFAFVDGPVSEGEKNKQNADFAQNYVAENYPELNLSPQEQAMIAPLLQMKQAQAQAQEQMRRQQQGPKP